jgi:hypothetical protein
MNIVDIVFLTNLIVKFVGVTFLKLKMWGTANIIN